MNRLNRKISFLLNMSVVVFLFSIHSAVAAIDEKTHCPEGDDWKNQLVIEVMNVGQGDSTFIRTPSGKTILIDGGHNDKRSANVIPILKECFGVEKLDYAVITHLDNDHWGGVIPVLEKLGAFMVYDPLYGAKEHFYDKYETAINKVAQKRKLPLLGQKNNFTRIKDEKLKITVVAVNGSVLNSKKGTSIQVSGVIPDWINDSKNAKAKNAASIALLVEYGDFRYFTGGDLTGGGIPGKEHTYSPDVETSVGEYVGPVTGMKANHHGSATSNNQKFLNKLQPQFVIVSVGGNGQYKHPNVEIMKRFFNLASVQQIFLTNIDTRRKNEPFFEKVYGHSESTIGYEGDVIIQVSAKENNKAIQQSYIISVDGHQKKIKVPLPHHFVDSGK